MKVIIDKSMAAFGITDVVYAFARGLDPEAELTEEIQAAILAWNSRSGSRALSDACV